MDQPHWLVQELTGEAVWTALALSAAWAWKNRESIRHRLERNPKPITISMSPAKLTAEAQPVFVSATIHTQSTVRATATVEKSRGTAPLARRLEELVSWYLHVS